MKLKTLFLLIGIILFIGIPFLLIPRLIKISIITCKSQYGPCNNVIQENLVDIKFEKLYTVKKELRNKLSQNVLVREYFIQYKFPNILEINLLEAKPKYAIADRENNIVLVDARGYVVSSQSSSSLPTLEIEGELGKIGEQVNKNILFAGELIYDMFSLYQIEYGRVAGDRLEMTTEDGIKIIYPLEGDKEVLVASLVAIVSRLKETDEETKIEEVKNVSEIDLRYKNPVLR